MTLFKSKEPLSVCGKGAEQCPGEQVRMLLLLYLGAMWEMLSHPRRAPGSLRMDASHPGAG